MSAMTGRRIGAVSVVVILLALTGCGDDEKAAVPAACEPTETPASAPASRVVASEAEGFSVELPGGWKDVVIDNAQIQQLFNAPEETRLDEAILNQVRTLVGRGGKLFAYDECRRTTTLNVLKVPAAPGLTNEGVAQTLPAQLAELKMRDVKVETVPIAAGPAVRATGTQTVKNAQGDDVDLLQIQYYVVSGASTFIAILATDDPGRDRATLEAIGNTFKLTQTG